MLRLRVQTMLFWSLTTLLLLSPDTSISVEKDKYNILAVLPCYRGHLNPGSGIVRSLIGNGHSVTVFTTSKCTEEVSQLMPGLGGLVESEVIPEKEFRPGLFAQGDSIYRIIHENGTKNLFFETDRYLQTSGVKFDGVFADLIANGAVLTAKRHNLPIVVQFMGPVMEKYSDKPSYWERQELPVENASERPSVAAAVLGGLFSGLYDLFISYPNYKFIKEVHKQNGWEPVHYHNGLFPFSYTQQNAIYIIHGAHPIVLPQDGSMVNMRPIGFEPDPLMYPPLDESLVTFLNNADSPVVFISLGTVLMIEEPQLRLFYQQLLSQSDFHFVWAIKKGMMQILNIPTQPVVHGRVYVGRYLPQGNLLSHPKVKLFVTHCGSNSVQDSIFALKPMITHPGFGDQVYLSNILGRLKVAKFMRNFDYGSMEILINDLLDEPTYTEMVSRLKEFKTNQLDLGGFQRGAQIVEEVIAGKIVVNRNVDPQDIFGIPVWEVRATVAGFLVILVLLTMTLFYSVYRLLKCFVRLNLKPNINQVPKVVKKD